MGAAGWAAGLGAACGAACEAAPAFVAGIETTWPNAATGMAAANRATTIIEAIFFMAGLLTVFSGTSYQKSGFIALADENSSG
jgi:hypothetical protein